MVAATSARIVETANGDLLIPIYGAPAGEAASRAAIVRSRDGGRTWPRDQAVEIGAASGISFQEPALAAVDGRLLAVMRPDGADNAAYETHSIDGGRTWSPPAAIRIAAQASELLPLTADSTGTASIAHAWGDWSRRYGDSRPTVVQAIHWHGADSSRFRSDAGRVSPFQAVRIRWFVAPASRSSSVSSAMRSTLTVCRLNEKVVPAPSCESTQIRPDIASTSVRAM